MLPRKRFSQLSDNTLKILSNFASPVEDLQPIVDAEPTLENTTPNEVRIPLQQAMASKRFEDKGFGVFAEKDSNDRLGGIWMKKEIIDEKTGEKQEWLVAYTTDDMTMERKLIESSLKKVAHGWPGVIDGPANPDLNVEPTTNPFNQPSVDVPVTDGAGHEITMNSKVQNEFGKLGEIKDILGMDKVVVKWADKSYDDDFAGDTISPKDLTVVGAKKRAMGIERYFKMSASNDKGDYCIVEQEGDKYYGECGNIHDADTMQDPTLYDTNEFDNEENAIRWFKNKVKAFGLDLDEFNDEQKPYDVMEETNKFGPDENMLSGIEEMFGMPDIGEIIASKYAPLIVRGRGITALQPSNFKGYVAPTPEFVQGDVVEDMRTKNTGIVKDIQGDIAEVDMGTHSMKVPINSLKKVAGQAKPEDVPIAPGIKSKNITMDETGGQGTAKVTIEFSNVDQGLKFYQEQVGTAQTAQPAPAPAEQPKEEAPKEQPAQKPVQGPQAPVPGPGLAPAGASLKFAQSDDDNWSPYMEDHPNELDEFCPYCGQAMAGLDDESFYCDGCDTHWDRSELEDMKHVEGDKDIISKLVQSRIEHENGEYVVKTEHGDKTLGEHKTKKDAVKQLQAIEINKHKNASLENKSFASFMDDEFNDGDASDVGSFDWTDKVLKDADKHFAAAHVVPDQDDYISYILDAANEDAPAEVSYNDAVYYYKQYQKQYGRKRKRASLGDFESLQVGDTLIHNPSEQEAEVIAIDKEAGIATCQGTMAHGSTFTVTKAEVDSDEISVKQWSTPDTGEIMASQR